MSQHIPFTNNYQDLSTDRGYQFKFFCERCGNGYMSSFQTNMTGLAGEAVRAVGGMLGGLFGRAADSAYGLQQAVGGPAHDAALRHAVEELRPQFHQCQRCGTWVCQDVCWNPGRNQCVSCSPKMDQEIAAIESEATIAQLRDKAYSQVDMTGGVDLRSAATGVSSVAAPVTCPSCHTEVPAGKKFCPDCGTNLLAKPKCPSCGTEVAPGAKFCADCGTRIGG